MEGINTGNKIEEIRQETGDMHGEAASRVLEMLGKYELTAAKIKAHGVELERF